MGNVNEKEITTYYICYDNQCYGEVAFLVFCQSKCLEQ